MIPEINKPIINENEQLALRKIEEDASLADVPALDNHPDPVATMAPLVLKDNQKDEFPYSR